jgi:hypothetical protein
MAPRAARTAAAAAHPKNATMNFSGFIQRVCSPGGAERSAVGRDTGRPKRAFHSAVVFNRTVELLNFQHHVSG